MLGFLLGGSLTTIIHVGDIEFIPPASESTTASPSWQLSLLLLADTQFFDHLHSVGGECSFQTGHSVDIIIHELHARLGRDFSITHNGCTEINQHHRQIIPQLLEIVRKDDDIQAYNNYINEHCPPSPGLTPEPNDSAENPVDSPPPPPKSSIGQLPTPRKTPRKPRLLE
ncbi:hypothetical protein TWF281_006787 [Arthrobotrys megalospora]